MTTTADQTTPRARRLAALRAWLVRRRQRLGRTRGNPFGRLAFAVLIPRRRRVFSATRRFTQFLSLPSCCHSLSGLGLGLAGGGGGSPSSYHFDIPLTR